MPKSASSLSPSPSKYPQPLYKDYDLIYIPKLNNFNVIYWKLAMRDYIEGNGLIAFIDGSITPPPETLIIQTQNFSGGIYNPDYKQWKQIDDQVQLLIMATFQDGLWASLSSRYTGKTAAELWSFIIQNVHRLTAMTHPDRVSNQTPEGQNMVQYNLPLYKACVEGNMKDLEEILDKSPNVVRDDITGAGETALMVACERNMNTNFVEKLISLMSPQDLAMQSSFGKTAMFGAAIVGNVEAMKMMVEKNHDLLNISDLYNKLPIHCAATAGEKHSVHYLLQVTGKDIIESKRLTLVHGFILGGFYDICLSLLQRYPELAVSPLETLTNNHSAFLSGANFNFWQQKIYSYLPDSDLERPIDHFNNIYDVGNPANEVEKVSMTKIKWSSMFWQIIGNFEVTNASSSHLRVRMSTPSSSKAITLGKEVFAKTKGQRAIPHPWLARKPPSITGRTS
ncbi:hypothetical protein R6Q59_014549 [Mikania micrantha]